MQPNPYRGLSAFTVDDATRFWGRDNEITSLLAQVSAMKVLLLYGKSGVGKTSLLHAGLGPRLRNNDYFPVSARLHADPVAAVQDQVIGALEAQGIAELRRAPTLAGLFERVSAALRQSGGEDAEEKPVILMLDQFEDLFSSFSENGVEKKRHEFMQQLADLVYRRDLPVSILFSLREDFLPEMAVFRSTIPSILSNYYRLGPLPRSEARKAIVNPLQDSRVRFDDDLVEALLDDLKEGEEGGVEPYALQMVCSHVWERWDGREARVPLQYYRQELGGLEKVLAGFVEERLREFPPKSQRVIKQIFAELFTARGRGRLVHVSSLYEHVRDDVASEEELRHDILEPLDRDHRLITIRALKNVLYCEPIHDTLSQKATQWREELDRERLEQRLREEHAARRKKRRLFGIIAGVGMLLVSASLVSLLLYRAKSAELNRSAKLAAADSVRALGSTRLLQKDYGPALQVFRKALSTYRDLGDGEREARTLIDIGRVYVFTGDFARAKDSFRRAQDLSRMLHDRVAEGEVLERLASLSELEGKVEEAMRLYAQSQQSYQAGGDLQASGRLLERLAQREEQTQHIGQAEQAYTRALESYETAGDRLGMVRVRTALERIAAVHAPWGFLVDLQSPKVYELLGTDVSIGRDIPRTGVHNDISFSNTLISRRHVVIHRNHKIEDLRSRNGTSINSRLLPYGTGVALADGDILILAGIKTLRFTTSRARPVNVPADAWAIVVDNKSRRYRYLTNPEYSVVIADGSVSLESGLSAAAQMQLRWTNQTGELWHTDDDWNVIFTVKESDYEYKTLIVPSGEWLELSGFGYPLEYVRLDPDRKRITDEGPAFQIVLLAEPLPDK